MPSPRPGHRTRLGPPILRRFFEHVVELCQQAGLVWGKELFFDATSVRANAALDSLQPRLREVAQQHLTELFAAEGTAGAEGTEGAEHPEGPEGPEGPKTNGAAPTMPAPATQPVGGPTVLAWPVPGSAEAAGVAPSPLGATPADDQVAPPAE